MTISAVAVPDQFTGNGSQTTFPIGFSFATNDQVEVTLDNVTQTEGGGADYTISGSNVVFNTAPASGVVVVLKPVDDFLQPADYPSNDPFPSATHEAALDKLTRQTQFLKDELRKAIRIPDEDPTADDPELPKKADRVNGFLGWDANGDLTVIAGTISTASVSAYVAANVLLAANEAALHAAINLEIGTDVAAYVDSASQAEAEAGTEAALRRWSPLRIAQAIAALAVTPLPKNYLTGLTLSNNGTDSAHDIDIAAGECRGSDDDEDIVLSAITKQIDATWVAGTGNGGLSSSLTAPANDTWYHVHAIMVGGSADVGFDTSPTAANLVADHSATAYRRIGSVLTDGSANIIQFRQVGDYFYWDDPVTDIGNDYSADPGTTQVTITTTVPTGVRCLAELFTRTDFASGTGNTVYACDIYATDATENTNRTNVFARASSGEIAGHAAASVQVIATDTSAQVNAKANSANVSTLQVRTMGWRDFRGKE